MSIHDDIDLAFELLQGRKNADTGNVEYLSADTKPTEKEARAALARVLLTFGRHARTLPLFGGLLLTNLAHLFDPSVNRSSLKRFWNNRTVDFRNISTGNTNAWRDYQIAVEVQKRCKAGLPKGKAIEEVAKKFGLKEPRHIKKILAKNDVKEMLDLHDMS